MAHDSGNKPAGQSGHPTWMQPSVQLRPAADLLDGRFKSSNTNGERQSLSVPQTGETSLSRFGDSYGLTTTKTVLSGLEATSGVTLPLSEIPGDESSVAITHVLPVAFEDVRMRRDRTQTAGLETDRPSLAIGLGTLADVVLDRVR